MISSLAIPIAKLIQSMTRLFQSNIFSCYYPYVVRLTVYARPFVSC